MLTNGKSNVILFFTGPFDESERQTGKGGSASLLVFLVSCLIFALLVVVIFFGIKLRRAYIKCKKENEESDQSVESSKSKSSSEKKQSQDQRRKGLFNNIGFTKYIVEPTEVAATSTVTTTATTTDSKIGDTHVSHVKETEL